MVEEKANMKKDRRHFVKQTSIALTGLGTVGVLPKSILRRLQQLIDSKDHLTPQILASDEAFWREIKGAYTVSSSILNLNNGGVSPQPLVVQDAVERYNRFSNELPSHYMWHILDKGKEEIRRKLAKLAGCSPEEIAINRNTTEALDTVIFGLQLQEGDEVVLTKQDYPSMKFAWIQRAQREGIVLKWLNFDFPIEDEGAIVDQFVSAFTDKTRVVHLTHVINWNGQILPVRKIAQEAHRRGIKVLVDGAHSFAHLNFKIPELECDYFGTSLHKWLCAPFGTGLLYIRKEEIDSIYPLFAAENALSGDIRKFEHLGTRSIAIEEAIGQAVDFHNMIGSERKAARLRYLKQYWASRVSKYPKVHLGTSLDERFSGALAIFSIEGITPNQISSALLSKWQIHTVAINYENISGVRITPNVYTLTEDLDRLIEAIYEMTKA